MEFVPVARSDAEEVSSFVHDMWVDTYAPIVTGGRARAEAIFDDWVGPAKIRSEIDRGHEFFMIVSEGATVGMLGAGPEGDDYLISKMYIIPECRGKGIGSRAMQFALEKGREAGCARAILEVNPLNTPAVNMYIRNGFEEAGRNQYEYGYTLIMAKKL
jgi:ribosomal protein S18 acetylase RimI-like enzyme